LQFSRDHHFSYHYEPWPGSAGLVRENGVAAGVGAARGSHR
jgi:hypothetical protein